MSTDDNTRLEIDSSNGKTDDNKAAEVGKSPKRILNLIRQKIPEGGFARNVLALMSGSLIGQAIIAAASPVLTRLYTPAEIGNLALYISVVTVGAVVLSWRYELAIVLPEDDRDAANLFILSTAIAVGMTIISMVPILLFRSSIVGLLGNPDIGPWLVLVPLSFLALGMYQVFNSWCTRKKQFNSIAGSKIGQSSAVAGVQISTGLSAMGTAGLIAGQVAGAVIASLYLFRKIAKEDFRFILNSFNLQRLKKTAAVYRKYPIYSTWPAFINIFSLSLPIFFMMHYYNTEFVGQYALSMRVLQIPVFLIGASVGKVYFQRLAQEKNRTGDISGLVENTFRKLLIIAVPGSIVLMLISPFLFSLVFGETWRTAGELTAILTPAMAIRFFTSPLSTAFGVSNRQEVAARWQISQLICTIVFLYSSLHFDNPVATIYAIMINDMLLYIVFLVLIFRISGAKFSRALKFSHQ